MVKTEPILDGIEELDSRYEDLRKRQPMDTLGKIETEIIKTDNRIKYDSTLTRKIFDELDGDFEARTRKIAKIYGLEDEVEQYLVNNGPYRSHNDLDSIMQRAFADSKVYDSIEDDDLESLVTKDLKINPIKLGYLLTKDLLKDCFHYFIYGSLPGKIQEEIAEKRGENAIYYTRTNQILEPIILGGISFGAFEASYNMVGGIFAALFGLSLYFSCMRQYEVIEDKKPFGSIFIVITYHSYKWIASVIKNSINGLQEKYAQKKEELTPKVRIETRIEEIPQLSAPVDEQIPVLIEDERINTK